MKNITKAKLYVALSVKKAKLYLQVIKTSFLLAKGKSLLTKKVRQNKVLFNKGKFVESFYFIFSTLFCHINIAFLKLIPLILYLKNKRIE